MVKNFSKSNAKTKQSAKLLSKLIAEAAQQKSKKNNVKTPFNIKKARAITEFKTMMKSKASCRQVKVIEESAP